MYFAVQNPDGEDVFPIAPEGYESRWVCNKDTYKKLVREGMIEWKKVTRGGVTKWQVYQKHYLKGGRKEVSDLWNNGSGNKKATKELSGLFDKVKVFDHPKPVELLRRIIQIATEPNSSDIVLDFFAGSGTTGAAVLEQNAEDGGDRRFILVQFPEETGDASEAKKFGFSNIAEITKERLRRAGRAISNAAHHSDWNGDVGFRALKVDTSNMVEVHRRPDETGQRDLLHAIDNIKPNRTAEDLLFQVLVDWGVELTLPVRRETLQGKAVIFVDENALVACFDMGITEDLVKELAGREPLRVVFRDNGFASDAVKINVEQVFRQLSPGTDVKSI